MADKTGSERLLSILSRLLLEHQAMLELLKEDDRGWKKSAIRYSALPVVRQQIRDRLRELSDVVRCTQFDESVIPLLTDVLEKTVVLHGVLPL
jgi:hypothetical protein